MANELLLDVRWTEIGGVVVPPLQLRRGELFRLVVPNHVDCDRSLLVRVLSGSVPHGDVRIAGTGVGLDDWYDFGRWPGSCVRWLRVRTGRGRDECRSALARVELDPTRRIRTMAGNPRRLLRLAAARLTAPRFIVTTTGGMDARGIERYLGHLRSDTNAVSALAIDNFAPDRRVGPPYQREFIARLQTSDTRAPALALPAGGSTMQRPAR